MKLLPGRVAAITGAGSGIGRALALRLAGRGCQLALCDVDGEELARTAGLARRPGISVTESAVDVADRASVYRWSEEVVGAYGRVNLLFNNAGVALGSTAGSENYGDFEWLFGVNFWGVVHGTRAFLPHLEASGDGHIINVSSVFGLIAVPGQGAYNASKAAVRAFTDALRMELEMSGSPVSATCVHPGGVKTNVARRSRGDRSVASIGLDAENGRAKFEKLLVTEPDTAASAILRAVEKNRRRVLVGRDAHVIDAMSRLLPTSYQRLVKRLVLRSLG